MNSAIKTSEIQAEVQKSKITILDCRPSAAYNGWPLQNESRGGHIPGAISFPANWLTGNDANALGTLLTQKLSESVNTIILTGYPEHYDSMLGFLNGQDYDQVRPHTGGMVEWAADTSLPINALPNYKHLVHPDWLQAVLAGNNPEPGVINKYILAHVNFDNWGDYDKGHIPGAIWLDTLLLEDEYTWNRHRPEVLEKNLCELGITRDTTVILYGRNGNANMSLEHPGKEAGQIASMRAALILMYAGVRDVRVLDGGIESWQRAGGNITSEETDPSPVKSTGLHIPEYPELIVDTPQAKEMIADPNAELVSMRSWEEIIGNVSGYHYIEKKGRIPGAIWGNNGSDAYHMENNRNHDNTMLAFPEIAATWKKYGITPDKHIAFYCGTGWRGSEAFYCAWLMGWPKISIYDGGWFEWSSDPDNPYETGVPSQ